MPERIEQRRIPFPPPYGRELPLPSGLEKTPYQPDVFFLEGLWLVIRRDKLSSLVTKTVINHFYDNLGDDKSGNSKSDWMEADDPRWRKPRGVLVKERAIQFVQKKQADQRLGELEEQYPGIVEDIKTVIAEALLPELVKEAV